MAVTAEIRLNVDAASVADLKQMIVDIFGVSLGRVAFTPDQPEDGAVAGTVALDPKPATTRTRRTKAQIAADENVKSAAAADAEQPGPDTAEPTDEPGTEEEDDLLGLGTATATAVDVTIDHLREAGTAALKNPNCGTQGLGKILGQFGVKKLQDLPKDKYAACLVALQAAA